MRRPVFQTSWWQNILLWLGAKFVRLLSRTWQVRIEDPSNVLLNPQRHPVIWIFWHNRILQALEFHRRYVRPEPCVVLTSASRDGAILAKAMSLFGLGNVRGSSSRRGAVALRELQQILKEGQHVVITPDGPRGPRYQLAPGSLFLAAHSGIGIITVAPTANRYWELKTWDGFQIPRPWAKVTINLGQLQYVTETEVEEDLEALTLQISTRLGGERVSAQ
ncbi:MAG: lysophospholipid acyltransferase family protein [Verrucomicrobiales bacterium]